MHSLSRNIPAVVVLIFSLLAMMAGCETLKYKLGLSETPPSPPAPRYYDFHDVLVPGELKLDRDESMIYEFQGMKVGMLKLKGRVEVQSLVDFFRKYMPKDGWTLVSSAKFSKYLLNFVKGNRTCQVIVSEGTFSTSVEIWVHPISSKTSG